MTDPLIGTMIAGKYRIHRLLGSGGMGAVYAGEHLEIGKRVAIKVINESHANSPEVAARFRREARAASAVESASIVHVFDVGHDPVAGLYMVMEYLDGEDLASRLGREKRIAPEDVIAIGFQSCRALAKAHAAGVIHRDLKPANIYLTTREDDSLLVKILDFGISKLLNDAAAASIRPGALGEEKKALTRMGAAIGTPQYMSPEQAQGIELDQRSDVWSMGACLYEALAGAPAYEELATYEQTIIRIVTTPAKPLAQVAPWVPRALAEVVDAALARDLSKRIPDCGTFARRLKESVGADTNPLGSGPHDRMSVPGAGPPSQAMSSDLRASHSQPVDTLASTIAADTSPVSAQRAQSQPDFSRTIPLSAAGYNLNPPLAPQQAPVPVHPAAGTSTGTAVMMPEPTIPGVGRGVPILIAAGGALVALLVVGGGIFVATRQSPSPPAVGTTSVASATAQALPSGIPGPVAPLEAIVPIGAASDAPLVVPPIPSDVPVAAPPKAGHAAAHASPPASALVARTSPKASTGPTTPSAAPAPTSVPAPTSAPLPPPKKGQFGGAGVDDQY